MYSRLLLSVCLAIGGCKVGEGQGSASGLVWAPDCNLEAEPYDLKPTFFGAEATKFADIVEINIQKGNDFSDISDGIAINVSEAELIKTTMLGVPIDLFRDPVNRIDSPVRMIFSLGETCFDPLGLPVVYEAESGTITFDALYVPWVDKQREITATFSDVEFIDSADPTERRATLSGDFTFLFQRGIPAQPFP